MKLSRLRKLSWKLLLVYAAVIVLLFFADRRVDKWTRWPFWVGLAFLSFSVSLWYFNRGNIFTSAPLAYPPLVYLLVRCLMVGRRVGRMRIARTFTSEQCWETASARAVTTMGTAAGQMKPSIYDAKSYCSRSRKHFEPWSWIRLSGYRTAHP